MLKAERESHSVGGRVSSLSLYEAARRLSLGLRRNSPQFLRRSVRIWRELVGPKVVSSAHIPAELLGECRVCPSRKELVTLLPKHAVVAEVGVERGLFSAHILEQCAPAELHLVDLSFSQLAPTVASAPAVTIHNGVSWEILATFPDAYFDWIYIDADHSYEGAIRDAVAAAPKLKQGGYLVFNDFAHIDPYLGRYGVHRAVTEFATSYRWPFAWLALDTMAQYDVALRKPAPPQPVL